MVMTKKNGPVYEFGPFRVDTVERQLTRDGDIVPLQPKVFETLLVLVENSSQILEKNDLLSELWPDTFVEESSLTQNIFHLRKALGESGSKHTFIETIPRRGYRFVAQVRKISEEQSEPALAERYKNEALHYAGTARTNGTHPVLPHSIEEKSVKNTDVEVRPGIEPLAGEKSHRFSRQWLIISTLIFAAAILAIAGYLIRLYWQSNHTTPFQTMQISKLTVSGNIREAAISPDGKYVAYTTEKGPHQSLWVRQTVTTASMQVVEPDRVLYKGVTFSRDSNFIYFVSYERNSRVGNLFQIPVLGGVPVKVIEDVDSPVTFSPDGQHLAFTRNYPAERETSILIADADGGNERRLATRKEPDVYSMNGPAWSPDGKTIASAARGIDDQGNYTGLVAIRVEDGTERPLTEQKWNWVGQIAWKKDGRSLINIGWHRESCVLADQIWLISYPDGKARRITNDLNGYLSMSVADNGSLVSIQSQRASQIYTATDATLRNVIQITSGFGDYFSNRLGMNWMPGGRIIYSSTASGNPDIWVIDADGSNHKQLTFDSRGDFAPQVTSDGRYAVFVSERKGTPNIWRMDTDGSNLAQLTSGTGEYTPSLSPDGRWVIYYSAEDGSPGLWKVSIDGGAAVRVSEKRLSGPSVSPDGKMIACFVYEEGSGVMKPAVIGFEGGEIIRKFDGAPFPSLNTLQWYADSSAFIYAAFSNGASNIWLQPVDGSPARMLSDFKSEHIFRLALSPDGKRFVFERGNDINDVVLITGFN